MYKPGVITLIAETPEVKGVFDPRTEIERRVFCTVGSVGMQEQYLATGQGFAPEYRFRLAHDFEYKGEKRLIYKGVEYRVIRTYMNDADGIELTAERSNHDV